MKLYIFFKSLQINIINLQICLKGKFLKLDTNQPIALVFNCQYINEYNR